MIQPLLYLIAFFAILIIILIIIFRPRNNNELQSLQNRVAELQNNLDKLEKTQREEFKINREENLNIAKDNRIELNNTLKEFKTELADSLKTIIELNQTTLKEVNKTLSDKLITLSEQDKSNNNQLRETLTKTFNDFQTSFDKNVESFNNLQREKFSQLGESQAKLIESTEKKLEQMRETVDEKLQKTLNERLTKSFETVGNQLQAVQEGLGEMRTLAQDVGGLKRVLSNVKTRGGVGEVQLEMLLSQILAPEQFEANVKTKKDSNDIVEFAIKLPGRDENQTSIYLPIDAKFPKDAYENLLNAYDTLDPKLIESASKAFDNAVKSMAKDICDKYLDPPNTTDFGIMFLPFESIYAEVVKKASLLEDLQRNFKIVVTGPTTLAAILNSLQMGFRTLALQKRSSEVWQILGAVKKEFENFGGMLEKAQNNIQTGLNQLDDVMGKRTRAIQRKLRGVEALEEAETKLILPESSDLDIEEENDI